MTPTARTTLRTIAIVIGVVEALAMLAFVVLMLQASGPISASIGQGMAMLTAAPLCLLVLPGLYLACADRWIPAALVLVVATIPVAAVLWLAA